MAFSYISEDDLLPRFRDAQKFMLPLFEPMDEWERIARNLPHPGIDKSMPKVTDGTLAALIQEQPKRVIQQIPTGKVKSDDEWLNIVAGFIYEHEILPNANSQAALIQKCWAAISKSLTYGSQPALVQFINRGDYFGTDFTLPYAKDVLLEPGKLSDKDSNVIFLRSWYQPNQIDAIIEKEKMLGDRASERGDNYESGWDLKLLANLKDQIKQKDVNSQSPSERGKQNNKGFIEIVHAFQRGIGATFYSFAPAMDNGANIVRRRKNRDPRGVIPIHYLYSNVDLSNPLGRGAVEMSGGMQNLLDSEVQSYQYMRALLMNPPLEVRGNIPSSTLKYAPNALWKLGSDPNASVTPAKLETASLNQFPQNYGLIKSQILNLNSSTDTSVSAEVGNPGFSKTDAGVKNQAARLGVSDNYMLKQFEGWFEELSETAINLYFAERSGSQELKLDDDTAGKLEKVAPGTIHPETNIIRIDYDTETPKLKFEVDATTSSAKDDVAERDRLVELLDLAMKYPALSQVFGDNGIKELANRIVIKTGVEDPEKIVGSDELDEQGNPVPKPDAIMAQQHQEEMQKMQQQVQELQQKLAEEQQVPYKDAPEDIKRQKEERAGYIPSQSVTTDQQKVDIAAEQAQVQAMDMAHKHADMAHGQTLSTSSESLKIAQAQKSASDSDRTHEFTVKQANKPQPKVAAK